jgi:peptidyl-Lys metalloendopeptidase
MKEKRTRPELAVDLVLDRSHYKASERHLLTFSMTNESTVPITLLKWHTPFSDGGADLFHIAVDGRRAVYMGTLVKRRAPTAADYLTLAPGQRMKTVVDLSKDYDIADVGIHTVRFRGERLRGRIGGPTKRRPPAPDGMLGEVATVKARTAIFTLDTARRHRQVGGVATTTPARLLDKLPHPAEFLVCSKDQSEQINAALVAARKLAQSAAAALLKAPTWARNTAKRYSEWFGLYDAAIYATALAHFESIASALDTKQILFSCVAPDHPDDFAYVRPTEPYTIYLGTLFWDAPLNGTDSRAGTLIHEMSHFDVVADTDDVGYQQAFCEMLAALPAMAVDNADSHEYFAENTPALTMAAVPGTPHPITKGWRTLPSSMRRNLDAAISGGGPFANKAYFFKGNMYARYDWLTDRVETGAMKVTAGWHGMPKGFTGKFDAVIDGRGPFASKAYFFKGTRYVRYDWGADRADSMPVAVSKGWHGMPKGFTGNFDAIINGSGPFAGKCYFFKGGKYVRYDWLLDVVDQGPTDISAGWHGLPAGIQKDFDAALAGEIGFAGRGYFFKGSSYVQYDWAGDYCIP